MPSSYARERTSWERGASYFERADQSGVVRALAGTTPLADPEAAGLDLDALYASARGPDLARMIRGAFLHVENNDEACTRLEVPALIMAGDKDEQWIQASRRLHDLIPGSEFQLIPNAGHLAHLEQPDIVGRLIADFITFATER